MLEGTPALRHMDPLAAEWVTVMFLLFVAVLAAINVSAPRKWRLLAQAAFQMRLGRQALREEVDVRDRQLLSVLVVAIGVVALFFWQGILQLGEGAAPAFWRIAALVAGIVIAQGLLLRVLSGLANTDSGTNEYLFTSTLQFVLLGLALFPIVVLMAYRPSLRATLITVGAVLIGFYLLYRWVRGAWIGLGEGVPIRYIFLYFCAAEILPVLIAMHAVRQHSPQLSHL